MDTALPSEQRSSPVNFLALGGGPGVGNGLPQETAFCRKRPAVGNSLYQETAETILRHLFRKK